MKITEISIKAQVLAGVSKKKLPVKLGFAVSCNLDELVKWQKKTEEQRIELCKQYANKDDKGEPIINDGKFDIDDMDALTADVQELMDEDIDVRIRKVPEGLLDLIDVSDKYDALTPEELSALQFMLNTEG